MINNNFEIIAQSQTSPVLCTKFQQEHNDINIDLGNSPKTITPISSVY